MRPSLPLFQIVLLIMSGCTPVDTSDLQGVQVNPIPLSGPVADRKAEISGMDWFGDYLILLPQFPDKFGKRGEGALFALSKSDILDYLDGKQTHPLKPTEITFISPQLEKMIPGFQGFESLAFWDNFVFLTIEAGFLNTKAYLISGTIAEDLSLINLDSTKIVEIPTQARIPNFSDETILLTEDGVITLYEANGARVNAAPIAHRFDYVLDPLPPLPLTHLEYRITDATAIDSMGRFWVINLYYFGDLWIRTNYDLLSLNDPQHMFISEWKPIERLVELQIEGNRINKSGRAPIYLKHDNRFFPSNWEAIARLNEQGFLIASDKFPTTLLGFVPLP